MLILEPTSRQISRARREARKMGVLANSVTKGRGNFTGMLGEIMFHAHYGGTRVGHKSKTCDVVLDSKLTVDVKTQTTHTALEDDCVVRIYAPWESADWLKTKCDVYFFIKIQRKTHLSGFVGWMHADEFIEQAEFTPSGSQNPFDGRRARSEEFSMHSSDLQCLDSF